MAKTKLRKEQLAGLMALVDFLQDYTDIAERLTDYSDDETENNPEGEYAQVERWLLESVSGDEEILEQFANGYL